MESCVLYFGTLLFLGGVATGALGMFVAVVVWVYPEYSTKS